MPDAVTADWLKSDGLRVAAANASAAGWGTLAIESEVHCPFDQLADATAEAARQIDFLGPAKVIEVLRVEGRRADLIGRAVTLTADIAGYRAGATVFVIGATEIADDSGTQLTVIRRLA